MSTEQRTVSPFALSILSESHPRFLEQYELCYFYGRLDCSKLSQATPIRFHNNMNDLPTDRIAQLTGISLLIAFPTYRSSTYGYFPTDRFPNW